MEILEEEVTAELEDVLGVDEVLEEEVAADMVTAELGVELWMYSCLGSG